MDKSKPAKLSKPAKIKQAEKDQKPSIELGEELSEEELGLVSGGKAIGGLPVDGGGKVGTSSTTV